MYKKRLTSEQVEEIIQRYPDEKAEIIARDYRVNVSTIYKTAQRYKVKKSESFRNSPDSGRIQKGNSLSPETQFKKGHEGPTKGRRMKAVIKNKEKYEKWQSGLWKKGHKPYNTAKNGEVRWRHNPGYYFIRIEENEWQFYHRYIWEQKNGKIQEDFNVIFIDGNRRNCKIENLACISNAELAEMNRHTKYPEELRKAIELRNKLIKQITNNEQKH